MSEMLELRERIKEFCVKNEMYVMPVVRFVLALTVILVVNGKIGFMAALANPVIVIMAALLCAFLPINVTVGVGCLYLIGNCYALSLEVAIVAAVIILLMFLLYFRFATKDAYIMLLVPLAFLCKIPYVAPLLIGLMSTPVSMVSMAFGIIIFYFVTFVNANSGVLSATSDTDLVGKITLMMEGVFSDKMMILLLIAFMATVLVTYLVRRLNIDYVWNTATIVGSLTNLLIVLLGQLMLNTSGSLGGAMISLVISCIIVIGLQFVLFSLDYSRTEYVQFEDDEYYYYVKAVPKLSVSTSSKKVQKINPHED